jgi:hypothetical protein
LSGRSIARLIEDRVHYKINRVSAAKMQFCDSVNVPSELVSLILDFLDIKDVGRFGLTCKRALDLAGEVLRPEGFSKRFPGFVREVYFDALLDMVQNPPRPHAERYRIKIELPRSMIPMFPRDSNDPERLMRWELDPMFGALSYFDLRKAATNPTDPDIERSRTSVSHSETQLMEKCWTFTRSALRELQSETILMQVLWCMNYERRLSVTPIFTYIYLNATSDARDAVLKCEYKECSEFVAPSREAFELLEKSFGRSPCAAFRFLMNGRLSSFPSPKTVFHRTPGLDSECLEKLKELTKLKRRLDALYRCQSEEEARNAVVAVSVEDAKRLRVALDALCSGSEDDGSESDEDEGSESDEPDDALL